MCSGARRCMYCEDSIADAVEHIHPKDLYPNLCFDWDNYLFACRPCNGQKNKKFAIFRDDNQTFQVVNPPKGTKASEPPKGEAAIINPRIENQLDFCILDLKTFKFVSIKPKGSKDVTKAEYTYNEVLRLNERGVLRISRETAYVNYVSRLGYYTSEKEKGRPQKELDRMIENLKKEAHPTVWREMQRQSRMGILILIDKGLNELFIK